MLINEKFQLEFCCPRKYNIEEKEEIVLITDETFGWITNFNVSF